MTRPCPTLTIKALALTCSEVMSSEKSHVTDALAKVNASACAICSAILNSCSAQIESGVSCCSKIMKPSICYYAIIVLHVSFEYLSSRYLRGQTVRVETSEKFIETKKVKKSQRLKLSSSWANLCTKQGKFSRWCSREKSIYYKRPTSKQIDPILKKFRSSK